MSIFKRQIANIITLTRIFGVVLIFWFTPYSTNFWLLVVAHLFTLICLTDFLDGWIARRLGTVSRIGKVLDPLADKILVLLFLPLLEMQIITAFPVFLILSREFAVMALRIVAAKDTNDVPAAGFSGKLKTAITMPVCGILLARVPVDTVETLPSIFMPFELLRIWILSWPNFVINVLIFSVVFVTIWSFITYFSSFVWRSYIKQFNYDEVRAKRALRVLIPNTFSIINLLSGILAIVLSVLGYFDLAVLSILIGIISDSLDGSLARRLDAYSKFGEQLDTKADLVTFGIAPSVFIYFFSSSYVPFHVSVFISIVYFACVVYRLWRFSLSGHASTFDGLPSPIAAGLVIFASLLDPYYSGLLFIGIILQVSILMITTLSYPHLSLLNKGRFTRKVRSFCMIMAIISMLALVGIKEGLIFYPYECVFGIVFLYSLMPFYLKLKYLLKDK